VQIDGDGGPSTIIAKLAAATEEDRFVATVLNMYGREVGFYNELSARTSIAHPECLFRRARRGDAGLRALVGRRLRARPRRRSGCGPFARRRPSGHPHARSPACVFLGRSRSHDVAVLVAALRRPVHRGGAMAYDMAWPRVQEFFSDM
jgi:hypothetical protein